VWLRLAGKKAQIFVVLATILPEIGQDHCEIAVPTSNMDSVPAQQPHRELVEYLIRTCPLSPAEAGRVVADVLGYFSEPPEEYVRRRHRELKARGVTNDVAFEQIAAEIPQRRYAPPEFSLRQLRRIVYG
jgi:hypothetical protein